MIRNEAKLPKDLTRQYSELVCKSSKARWIESHGFSAVIELELQSSFLHLNIKIQKRIKME